MDPLSLLIRSCSVSIYPWFNYGVRSFFDSVFSANPLGTRRGDRTGHTES